MKKIYHGTYAYKTDLGRVRSKNEDQAMVLMNSYGETFLVVCDGMGGAKKGELASKIAIDILTESFRHKPHYRLKYSNRLWITKAAKEANGKINKYAEKNGKLKGMGTTMVAALIFGNRIMLANIGDSRCYLLNHEKSELSLVTEDQTYVRYLVSTGKITEEEALSHPDRHVLMNALGIYPSVSLNVDFMPYFGQSVLLCSDGLYNQVTKDQIANILLTDDRTDQKVASLVAEANHNGGSDNVGIALWEAIAND